MKAKAGDSAAARQKQTTLFDAVEGSAPSEPSVKPLRHALWTESKARLIQKYLRLFTFITKHGTYIDAFAGPQRTTEEGMWSAKLVLESEPRWLRHFHLFERDEAKVARLQGLVRIHNENIMAAGEKKPRDVHVYNGDCNVELPRMLETFPIGAKEATFALLDQRTFECHWETLRALATHKKGGNKIELFYFLPNKWLARAMSGITKNLEVGALWWGRDDWKALAKMNAFARAKMVTDRIRSDFGYASVKAWPIHERKAGGGSVMYFMIHATDHPDAPVLMRRAFEHAVDPTKPVEQLALVQ